MLGGQQCQSVVEEPSQMRKSESKDFVRRLFTCDGDLLVAVRGDRDIVEEVEGGRSLLEANELC